MPSFADSFSLATSGRSEILDLTPEVQLVIRRSGIDTGIACVAIAGATAGITTIEYESGALHDLAEALNRVVPVSGHYQHDARWGDGNGYAHVRSALVGTSRVFPVRDGQVLLGTWQQIVLIDFDNRPRQRRIDVSIVGERVGAAPDGSKGEL